MTLARQFLVVAVAIAGASLTAAAQQKAKPWTQVRTAWGDPDLQGTWTNETITPFERPTTQANKPFLTPAEAAALEARAAGQRDSADDAPARSGDVGSYNQAWFDSGTKVVSTLQSSLVVDPPDGRVPLRPDTIKQHDEYIARETDSVDFMSPWDRCISRGIPGGFFPAGYNNGYQILQGPGYVVIHYEMIHAARIIPTDGRQHRPSHLRSVDGDSVGHWEGNTLVVDTTNFTNLTNFRGSSEKLHLVERFTRSSDNVLTYQFTVEDPTTWDKAWTAEAPMTKSAGPVYEWACHEGNTMISTILRGARLAEEEAAHKAAAAK